MKENYALTENNNKRENEFDEKTISNNKMDQIYNCVENGLRLSV